MTRHRAERIARCAGDGARAVDVDGEWAVEVSGGRTEFEIADRLARSSDQPISTADPEQLIECDDCHLTVWRPFTSAMPRGWVVVEDSRGDLVGFRCPSCEAAAESPWEAIPVEGEIGVAGPTGLLHGTPSIEYDSLRERTRIRLIDIERVYDLPWSHALDRFLTEFPIRDGGIGIG